MEVGDREASHIHGIISSDSDSDYNGTDFDEEYHLLKPPPLDYDLIKDKIVVISREQVVNVWEERLENLDKNSANGIQAVNNLTLVTKKKKRKKSKAKPLDVVVNPEINYVEIPALKKSVTKKNISNKSVVSNKNSVCVKTKVVNKLSKKALNGNAQKQVFNNLPSESSCSYVVGTSRTKTAKATKVTSPKVFYDRETLKKVEEKISGLNNVWHSGLNDAIIHQELSLQRQKESSMYDCWMKSVGIKGNSEETIKIENKTDKNKGKTKEKAKQPVLESPSTNLAKKVKDIKTKTPKGDNTQNLNLTHLDKEMVEHVWQWFRGFSHHNNKNVKMSNITIKTKKKTRSKKKSKQSVSNLVNQGMMNESLNHKANLAENMPKQLATETKVKTDFKETLKTCGDEEIWNPLLGGIIKKDIPKKEQLQVFKHFEEKSIQNSSLAVLDQQTERVWHLDNFFNEHQQFNRFSVDSETNAIFNSEIDKANTTIKTKKKTRSKKKSKQSVNKLTNQSPVNELCNYISSEENMTKQDADKYVDSKLNLETFYHENLNPQLHNWFFYDNIDHKIQSTAEIQGETTNHFNIDNTEQVDVTSTTVAKSKTNKKKKSKQLTAGPPLNEVGQVNSVANLTKQSEDEAKVKTDFEEVLETSWDEEKCNAQLLDNEIIREEILKKEEVQIIKDYQENSTQNANITVLDAKSVECVGHLDNFVNDIYCFDAFSNDIENKLIFNSKVENMANTITKTKKKTRSKKKSKQSADKLMNQSPVNELCNYGSLEKNMTKPNEDEYVDSKLTSEASHGEIYNPHILDGMNDEITKRLWFFSDADTKIQSAAEIQEETTNHFIIDNTEQIDGISAKSKRNKKKKKSKQLTAGPPLSEVGQVNSVKQSEDEAKVQTDFEETLEISWDEEKCNAQLLEREIVRKEIPKKEKMQIKDYKENNTQNANITVLDEKSVEYVRHLDNFVNEIHYFDGFSNGIESNPIFNSEIEKPNTATKIKKRTRSKKKSKQSVDKLMNQSPVDELCNYASLEKNMTKPNEDEYVDSKLTSETSHGEKCNPHILDEVNDEIIKRLWFFSDADTKIQSAAEIQGETTNHFISDNTEQINITSTIVAKSKTNKKKKKSKQLTAGPPLSEVGQDNSVKQSEDEAKVTTDMEETLEMSWDEEKCNLLDREIIRKEIPKKEKMQIIKDYKENSTQNANITVLDVESVECVRHLDNFVNEIHYFDGFSNDVESNSIFNSEIEKINTATKTKKKTRSKKKSKQSVDKLTNQNSTDEVCNYVRSEENMTKHVEDKYADSNQILDVFHGEKSNSRLPDDETMKRLWFFSDDDVDPKIQSAAEIQVESTNHFNIDNTVQVDVTPTIVAKSKTNKKKKKSKQLAAEPLLNEVSQDIEKTNEDEVKLDKRHSKKSTNVSEQQIAHKCLDLNSVIQETILHENIPINEDIGTFDKTATLEEPQHVFGEGFRDFIQDILCEDTAVAPNLSSFTYEQLQRAYTVYQEKKNTKQQNVVASNVATKNRARENNIFWPSFGNPSTNVNFCFTPMPVPNYTNENYVTYPHETNIINNTSKLLQERQITEANTVVGIHSSTNFLSEAVNSKFSSQHETKSSGLHDKLKEFEDKRPTKNSTTVLKANLATNRGYDSTVPSSKDFDKSFGVFSRTYNDAVGIDVISTSNADQYKHLYRVMYNGRKRNSSNDVKRTINDTSIVKDNNRLVRHLGNSNDDLKSNSRIASTYGTLSSSLRYRDDIKNTGYHQDIVSDQNMKKLPFSWENQNYYDRSSKYMENFADKQLIDFVSVKDKTIYKQLGNSTNGVRYNFEDEDHSIVSYRNETSNFDDPIYRIKSFGCRDNENNALIFVFLHIFFIGIVAVLVVSIITNVVSFLYNNIFFLGLLVLIYMKFKS